MSLEQAIEILSLISKANASQETVQQTLIERFDLIETMLRYPGAVAAMDPAAFEAFLLGDGAPDYHVSIAAQIEAPESLSVDYAYPDGWGLRPVQEQLAVLAGFFPQLNWAASVPASLPEGAEGWLVVPKPSRIAESYCEALERVISCLARSGPAFSNSRDGKLDSEYLRLTERTRQALDQLEGSTPGDYLVLAVQCGLRYRPSSVSDARHMLRGHEFGLGPFEVASLLLTHPERLSDYEHLGIDCPGCTYAPDADAQHSHAICFIWDSDAVYLDCGHVEANAPGFGAASGFL